MTNFIFTVIVLAVVGLAVRYIIKEKKRGVKCVGCPSAGCCCSGGAEAEHSCHCSDHQ